MYEEAVNPESAKDSGRYPDRRFPPPWDIEEHNRSCFIVRDNNGRALSYVYYETEPGRRTAANLLTRDEAHRIAANIAKLPELLRPGRKIKSPLRRRASLVRENQRVPAIPRRSK